MYFIKGTIIGSAQNLGKAQSHSIEVFFKVLIGLSIQLINQLFPILTVIRNRPLVRIITYNSFLQEDAFKITILLEFMGIRFLFYSKKLALISA